MESKILINSLFNLNLVAIKIKYGVNNLIILLIIKLIITINVRIKYVINKNLHIMIKML
jgi:hypothetical protein